MSHPPDAVCTCGHALWLHTSGCIALNPAGRSQMQTAVCTCGKSIAELAK